MGEKGLFSHDDTRLRLIPFPTRRPTFSEVCSTHVRLATLYVGAGSPAGVQQSEPEETRDQEEPGKVGGGGSVGDEEVVRGGIMAEVKEEVESEEEEEEKGADVSVSGGQGTGKKKKKKRKKQAEGEGNEPSKMHLLMSTLLHFLSVVKQYFLLYCILFLFLIG